MVGQALSEEDNVGLHNSFRRHITWCTWFFTICCTSCRCFRYFKVTFTFPPSQPCWGGRSFARYWRIRGGRRRFSRQRSFFGFSFAKIFAAGTERDSPFKDVFSDGVGGHLEFAISARGGREAAVALHHLWKNSFNKTKDFQELLSLLYLAYPSLLLEGVDVLGVIPQQLLPALQRSNKLMTRRGRELARVDLTCKFEKRSWISPKSVSTTLCHCTYMGRFFVKVSLLK